MHTFAPQSASPSLHAVGQSSGGHHCCCFQAGEQGERLPLLSVKLHKSWIADVQLLPTGPAYEQQQQTSCDSQVTRLPHLLTASNDGSVSLWDLSKCCDGRPQEVAHTQTLHTGWSCCTCTLSVCMFGCPSSTLLHLTQHSASLQKCWYWGLCNAVPCVGLFLNSHIPCVHLLDHGVATYSSSLHIRHTPFKISCPCISACNQLHLQRCSSHLLPNSNFALCVWHACVVLRQAGRSWLILSLACAHHG